MITLDTNKGPLQVQLKREMDSAKVHGQQVLVDVGAEWCPPCKQLEQTFDHPLMISSLAGARVVHLDFDEWQKTMREEGYIDGAYELPELFVLDSSGKRLRNFQHSLWADYAEDSLHVSDSASTNGKKPSDAEWMGPPLRMFLESAKNPAAGDTLISR